ncbi:hypothetical protein TNCV_2962201 [Trichonephila clavipes]|nr:hypothetical protein TNCV_2962201 [Trichonephila clavipes]
MAISLKTHLRSYPRIERTRPHKPEGGLGKSNKGRRQTVLWSVTHQQVSGNYWEERCSQPTGAVGAFKKLFCWPLKPALTDEWLITVFVTYHPQTFQVAFHSRHAIGYHLGII